MRIFEWTARGRIDALVRYVHLGGGGGGVVRRARRDIQKREAYPQRHGSAIFCPLKAHKAIKQETPKSTCD